LSTFSKGMLQRIGLAQALLNDPDIVFLDEPTSGLDPLGRRMVRDVIGELAEQGKTVFLNSHLLSEIEVTCTRVAFVTDGVVRHEIDLDEGYRDGLLFVTLRVDRVDDALLQGLARWSDQVEPSPHEARTVTLRLDSESALPEIARWVVGRGTALYSLAPRTLSLEDLFVSIVERNTP
jgi:ABC-2 type transport system ATP-binding protein